MNVIKKVVGMVSAAGLLTACAHTQTNSATIATQTEIQERVLPLKGEHAILLSSQQWLNYGPDDQISLSNAEHQIIDQASIKA
jgi:hypothetical protein